MPKEKEKAFNNFKYNGIHFNFPNGNWLSTIWGNLTYSDNYDVEITNEYPDAFDRFLQSDTVEIMFTCPSKLKKRILKKYNDGQDDPIGYLGIKEWLEIVKLLSKE